jgi:hypothetical protein
LVNDAWNGHLAAKALAKAGYVDAGLGADRMKGRRSGKARSDDEADRMTYSRLVSSSVE